MKLSYRVVSCVIVFALPVFARAGLVCSNGSIASVSGNVTTLNLTPKQQTGQICIKLLDARGKEVLNQCGAIIGNVQSLDTTTGSSVLNHIVVLNNLQAFTTQNDATQITAVTEVDNSGTPCAFSIAEKITNISWSSGVLLAGSADILALGTLSACPDKNLNVFSLSGQACIRKNR
jgi:hypothetical protein